MRARWSGPAGGVTEEAELASKSMFRQHSGTQESGDGRSGGHECKVTSCCTPRAAGPGPNSGMAYLGVRVGAGNGKHLA